MNVLAVIPARKGSKAIPDKNFKNLAGKPLIEWSVIAAQDSEYVDTIVLSSDHPGAEAMADDWGILYHKRNVDHATDEAPLDPVLVDVVARLKNLDPSYSPDLIVLLQPTSPVRPPWFVDHFVEWLGVHEDYDSVLSGVYDHALTWDEIGRDIWTPNYDPISRQNRQDQGDRTIRETGSIFVTRRESLLRTGCRCSGKVMVLPTPPIQAIEIDVPFDWFLAEQVMLYGGV